MLMDRKYRYSAKKNLNTKNTKEKIKRPFDLRVLCPQCRSLREDAVPQAHVCPLCYKNDGE
jgi:hypothetical protein